MESFFATLPLPLTLLVTVGSLVLLIISSDRAIGGAVRLATSFHVSPLVIGTTLVAMSTSLAELAVNLAVTLTGGNNTIVVGNIFGSNLVNIGFGLGIPAMLTAIRTATLVIEREILLYFAITALFTAFALDAHVTRAEGGILVGSFSVILFLIYQYASRDAGVQSEDAHAQGESGSERPITSLFLVVGALAVLVLSAELLISSVTVVARAAGISTYVISLTVIGIGTSLPEIATSIQAARKGYIDLVLGNVFGSNIFNICIALGLPALIRPITVPRSGLDDIYFINLYGTGVIFLLLLEFRGVGGNKVIERGGGVVIAGTYLIYLLYRVLIR